MSEEVEVWHLAGRQEAVLGLWGGWGCGSELGFTVGLFWDMIFFFCVGFATADGGIKGSSKFIIGRVFKLIFLPGQRVGQRAPSVQSPWSTLAVDLLSVALVKACSGHYTGEGLG